MRHKLTIPGAVIMVLVVSLVAGVAAAPSSTGGSPRTAASSTAPVTLVYALPSLPQALDTFPFAGDGTQFLNFVLRSQLMDWNTSKLRNNGCYQLATNANVTGDLAKSWTVSKNGLSVTVQLRNARSAAGNPLTADDVKWSFERELALGPFMPGLLGSNGQWDINNFVTVLGPHTVRLNIAKPFSFAVAQLTNVLLMVWDKREVLQHATSSDPWGQGWLANHTADFGPWQLVSFTPGSQIIFQRNPYYKLPRGNVTRLVVQAVPDAGSRTQLLKAGSIDITTRLSYGQDQQLTKTSGVKVARCVTGNRDFLMLNEKDSRLANVNVRRAISLAINRTTLAKVAYRGFAYPARFGWSQFLKFPRPPVAYRLAYNPTLAKQLLAAAGFPNGFTLNLVYSATRPGAVVQDSAPIIQAMLAQVGIGVKLQEVPSGTDFSTRYSTGNYEAMLYNDGSPLSEDPTYAGFSFLTSHGTNATFGYSSALFDQKMTEAKALKSGPQQQKLFGELAKIAVAEMPIVNLVDVRSVVAMRSNITGYKARPQGEWIVPSDLSKGG
jgi:peptide/nickel transport system substrate-binding protein